MAELGRELDGAPPSPWAETAGVPEPDEPGKVVPDGSVEEVAIALPARAGTYGDVRRGLVRRRRRGRRFQGDRTIPRAISRLAHQDELGPHRHRYGLGDRRVDVLDDGLDVEEIRVVPADFPGPEPDILVPGSVVLVIPPHAKELLPRRHSFVFREQSDVVRGDESGMGEAYVRILHVSAVEVFERLSGGGGLQVLAIATG
jgi:hypothetical protein